MDGVWNWYQNLSNQWRTSLTFSIGVVGLISTLLSIFGVSVKDCTNNWFFGVMLVIGVFALVTLGVYWAIGMIFRKSVSMTVRGTPVTVKVGSIFSTKGMRVIGCDSRFSTTVDDRVISRNSLHGQLVLRHGTEETIRNAVRLEARRLGIQPDRDGAYEFPLGTVIRYDSPVEDQVYLMVAISRLNEANEAHVTMAEFEGAMMAMWHGIDRIYARNPVNLPLLGSGILRFDDGPKDKKSLLRCLLCTLSASGVT